MIKINAWEWIGDGGGSQFLQQQQQWVLLLHLYELPK